MSDDTRQPDYTFTDVARRYARDAATKGAQVADAATAPYQSAKGFVDAGFRPDEIARLPQQWAPRVAGAAENLTAPGLRGMAYRALPYVAPALRGLGNALTMSPPVRAAATGYAAGDLLGTTAYNAMPRSWQDTIGGTVNQAMQRFGGGIDDSDYLRAQTQAPTAAPQMGMTRRMYPMMTRQTP